MHLSRRVLRCSRNHWTGYHRLLKILALGMSKYLIVRCLTEENIDAFGAKLAICQCFPFQ